MSKLDLFKNLKKGTQAAFLCCNILNVELAFTVYEVYKDNEYDGREETIFTLEKGKSLIHITLTEYGRIELSCEDSDLAIEAYQSIMKYKEIFEEPEEIIDVEPEVPDGPPCVSDIQIKRRNIVWETIRKLKIRKEPL